MSDFYLAFIISGFMGLFAGYAWGSFDGFKVGYEKGATSAENRLRAIFKAQTDRHPQ